MTDLSPTGDVSLLNDEIAINYAPWSVKKSTPNVILSIARPRRL
jgi:hypothetical protein